MKISYAKIYRLGEFNRVDWSQFLDAEGERGGGDDGDDPSGGNPPDGGNLVVEEPADANIGAGGDDDVDVEHPPLPPNMLAVPEHDMLQRLKMQREYLQVALKPRRIYRLERADREPMIFLVSRMVQQIGFLCSP